MLSITAFLDLSIIYYYAKCISIQAYIENLYKLQVRLENQARWIKLLASNNQFFLEVFLWYWFSAKKTSDYLKSFWIMSHVASES